MKSKEAAEQEALMYWAELNSNKHPELQMLYHIPNGGSRHKMEAANLKRQGVKAGVPDLCLPVPRKSYGGLYIEMKYGINKPTDKQLWWMKRLIHYGYKVAVCYNYQEAIDEILMYLR